MRLAYTGLLVELEHLKIKTTLIDEMFASVMGEKTVRKTISFFFPPTVCRSEVIKVWIGNEGWL
jgi:hypothetical protein